MLCEACQDIFSEPRKLAYGAYYSWKQNATSFQTALQAGCHLCWLVEENRSYDNTCASDGRFPENLRYAFKAINPKWARYGEGSKWFAPQTRGFDDDDDGAEIASYLDQVERDPTPNGLAALLAQDSESAKHEVPESWLVMEFYGGSAHLILPIELLIQDEAEGLAQKDLAGQTSTGSPENLELASTWLQGCLLNHSSCRPRQPEDWLPTRLLDVGTKEHPDVRLVMGNSLDPKSLYIALSHRWGWNNKGVLDLANYAEYQRQIPLTKVSMTVQDSIEVTRALGLRYLWVDSMCIIQDDEADWSRESVTMSRVYGLSTCTIAAANSGSGSGGYFVPRNQYRVRPCLVPSPFKLGSKYSFYIRSQYLSRIHDRQVRNSLWYNRGWVFQERTLSRRLLIFSSTQIMWACEKLQAAETWPCGKTSENHIDQFESFEVEKARFTELLDPQSGITMRHSAWWKFIQDYMASSELTVRSDRLVALQGIATLVQALTGQKYCAGFWFNYDLPQSLLWKTSQPAVRKHMGLKAPSWSWASVDTPIQLNSKVYTRARTNVQILGLENIIGGSGSTTEEALSMAGMLFPVTIVVSHDGNGCERVLTRKYATTMKARIIVALRKILRQSRDWVVSKVQFLWGHGLSYVGYFLAVIVLVPLAIAAIALCLGLIIGGIGLSPAIIVLWGVGWLLWLILKVAWRWIRVMCVDRRAAGLTQSERAQLNDEALRRREEAAVKFERVFADLEMGIVPPVVVAAEVDGIKAAEIETPAGIDVDVSCSFDTFLRGGRMVAAILLPVIEDEGVAFGLLLCAVDGTSNTYTRLGTFSARYREIEKLPHTPRDERFWII